MPRQSLPKAGNHKQIPRLATRTSLVVSLLRETKTSRLKATSMNIADMMIKRIRRRKLGLPSPLPGKGLGANKWVRKSVPLRLPGLFMFPLFQSSMLHLNLTLLKRVLLYHLEQSATLW